jgi:transcriptional regulator with XRE-family HTH domain
MLRDNLKAAVAKSGLIVKEIAARSGVNKRTVDKWVGASATEPKVNDLYRVCKVLSVTMEWIVDGEAGAEYVRTVVRNDPFSVRVPDRIKDIVGNLLLLDDDELVGIRANAKAMAAVKKGRPRVRTGNSLKARAGI